MKFASVRVVTNDLAVMAAFYTTLIGEPPTVPFGDGSGYVEFETPAGLLAIATNEVVTGFNGPVASAAANLSVIFEFEVENVDALQSQLKPLVTKWEQEPKDMPWGYRSMLFRDPDGNLVNCYNRIGGAQ